MVVVVAVVNGGVEQNNLAGIAIHLLASKTGRSGRSRLNGEPYGPHFPAKAAPVRQARASSKGARKRGCQSEDLMILWHRTGG